MSMPLDQLVCPISKELPVDPVLAQDGYIYERECIQKHLVNRNTSPMTNSPMERFIHRRTSYHELASGSHRQWIHKHAARSLGSRGSQQDRDPTPGQVMGVEQGRAQGGCWLYPIL